MKLSTLIAKIEDVSVRASKTIATKTATLVKDVKIEIKAARIARGSAEYRTMERTLMRSLDDPNVLQAAAEAAEIDARARQLLVESEMRGEAKAEAIRRREYIRKIASGEIKIP